MRGEAGETLQDLNHKPIDLGTMIGFGVTVNGLSEYCKEALKLAVVKNLGSGEGYSAKIPGFAGLVVFAPARAEVVRELKSALEGWIKLSARLLENPSPHV